MNIGMVPVDSRIPNLALMRLSAWHKAKGDSVKLFEPLFDSPDRVYLSKQFDFSPDFDYIPDCEIIRGGTGYDPSITLLPDQDTIYPDYDLFGCDYALGRLTRGCPRGCAWCIVPEQDGKQVRQVADLSSFWNGQESLRLLDDNILALPYVFERFVSAVRGRCSVSIDALDIRFVTSDNAKLFSHLTTPRGRFNFAFDSMSYEPFVKRGISVLNAVGVRPYRLSFYVLIGFNSTPDQDLYRVELLRSLGADPFVMPFDKSDLYQRSFARYCNHKAVFKSCSWSEYQKTYRLSFS